MKSLFVSFFLFLSVNADCNPSFLRQGSEYRFHYSATLTSGIPVKNSTAALTQLEADVHLQIPKEGFSVFRMHKVLISSAIGVEELESKEISEENKELLQLPVVVSFLGEKLVKELQFSKDDTTWSANIKRGVINMLQLDTAALEEDNYGLFSSKEKVIEGDCTVGYHTRCEGTDATVIKHIRLEQCDRQPSFVDNLFSMLCEECQYKSFVPKTRLKFTFQGEELQHVQTHSTYTAFLGILGLMKTEVHATLTLLETFPIRHPVTVNGGEWEEIIYSSKVEDGWRRFFREGEGRPMMQDLTAAKIKATATRIKEATPEALNLFSGLVEHLRKQGNFTGNISLDDLEAFQYALATAGTLRTIEKALERVKEMDPVKVSILLKLIQQTIYPSQEIADLLLDLSKKREFQGENLIRRSALLAFGSVVNRVVREKGHLEEKYHKILQKQWEEADSTYEKVLALKTIGNSGIDLSFNLLKKIVEDKEEELVVRVEAFGAFRYLVEKSPQKIRDVAFAIFKSPQENHKLRAAAVAVIKETMLHEAGTAEDDFKELLELLKKIPKDQKDNTAAYSIQMLNELYKSKLPCYQNFTSMLSGFRPFPDAPAEKSVTDYGLLPVYHEESKTGSNIHFSMITDNSALVPNSFVSLETLFGGNWNKFLVQFGIFGQNMDQLITRLAEASKKNRDLEKPHDELAPSFEMAQFFLDHIALKANHSAEAAMVPFGYVNLRFKDQDFAFFPLDKKLDEILMITWTDFEKLLNNSFDTFLAFNLYEDVTETYTSMGLPLVISSKFPFALSAKGKITLNKKKHHRVDVQGRISMAVAHYHKMDTSTPLFQHGVRFNRSLDISVPLHKTCTLSKGFRLHHNEKEDERLAMRVHFRAIGYVGEAGNVVEEVIRHPEHEKIVENRTKFTEQWGMNITLREKYTHNKDETMEFFLLGEQFFETEAVPLEKEQVFMEPRRSRGQLDEEKETSDVEIETKIASRKRRHHGKHSKRDVLNRIALEKTSSKGTRLVRARTIFPHKVCYSLNLIAICNAGYKSGGVYSVKAKFGCVDTADRRAARLEEAYDNDDYTANIFDHLKATYEKEVVLSKYCVKKF